jgi:hypothetical protein
MTTKKVIIELVGGVPKILECPQDVEVEIRHVNHWQRWKEELRLNKDKASKTI